MTSAFVFTTGVVMVAVVSMLAFLAIYLAASREARAGLASLGVTAAQAGPAAGIAAASWFWIRTFSRMDVQQSGGLAVVLGACSEASTLIRIGCGAAAVTLAVSALLALVGRSETQSLPRASRRGLVVLALPAFLAPALVGTALEYARRTRGVIIAVVVANPEAEPPANPDPDLQTLEQGAPQDRSSGSVAAISRRVATGLFVGVVGFPLLLLGLAGLGTVTVILGWQTRVPPGFAAALSGWMLAQGLLWTGAMFAFPTPAAV